MKIAFFRSQDFVYNAEVRPLATPAGTFSFRISSQWLSAKDPTAEQTQIQITLERANLVSLRDLIDSQVQS